MDRNEIKRYSAISSVILLLLGLFILAATGSAAGVPPASADFASGELDNNFRNVPLQQDAVDARIVRVRHPSGEYTSSDPVRGSVTVENTGSEPNRFYIGMSVQDADGDWWDGDNEATLYLRPGERASTDLIWYAKDDASAGTFDSRISVWKEENPDNLATRLADSQESNAFEMVSEQYELSVDTRGNGEVGIGPPGVATGSFQREYQEGTEIELAALPDGDAEFAGWSGDVDPSKEDDETIRVSLTESRDITARFRQPEPADFEITEFEPKDVEVTKGERIDVTATVKNTGGQEDSKTIVYDSNIPTVSTEEKQLRLAPNEEQSVQLTVVDTSEVTPDQYAHSISVQDSDEDGRVRVEPEPSVPPHAKIECNSEEYTAGDRVRCSAEDSSDSDGYITSYNWQFDNLGGASDTGSRGTHVYDEPGNYTVKVTVTDNDGLTDTTREQIRIESEREVPPEAAIECSTTELTVGESIECSAGDSVDADGYIDSYEWEFNDEGGLQEGGERESHTYANSGTYTVDLTVTDNDGQTDTAKTQIEVKPEKKQPPEPEINCSKSEVFVGESVKCSAQDSIDPDGDITAYDWQLDAKSGVDKSGSEVSFQFSDPGSYTVQLTVTDSDGLSSTVSSTIEVTQPMPEAAIECKADTVQTGESVTCLGDESTHEDGSVVSYAWEFGSRSREGESATHRFDSSGTKQIKLTVSDENGFTDSTTTSVYVNPELEVQRAGRSNERSAQVGDRITFGVISSSEADVKARALLISDGNTIDSETVVGNSVEFAKQFENPGERTIEIQLLGDAGQTESVAWEVDVEGTDPDIQDVSPPTSTLERKPGQREVFEVTTDDPKVGNTEYQWKLDGSPTATGPRFGHTFTQIGEHEVEVEVTRQDAESTHHEWDITVYPFNNRIDISDQTSVVEWNGEKSVEMFTFTVRNPASNQRPAETAIAADLPDGIELRETNDATYGTGSTTVSLESVEPGEAQSMRLHLAISEEYVDDSQIEIPYDVVYYPVDEKQYEVREHDTITIENQNPPDKTDDESPLRGYILIIVSIVILSRIIVSRDD
jgi:PKD repeat protein